MKRTIQLCVIAIFIPMIVQAQTDLKARADAAWAGRGNPEKALLAIELYAQLVAKNPNDFNSRIRLAQATYWAVEELKVDIPKKKKVELYNRAIKACNEIIARDEENVAAWYWLMWDMGARTLVKGAFSGWNLREAIVGTIMVTKKDVSFHYGGIYRYWARVIYETPGLMSKFLHFTNEDSVWLYKRAIAVEPKYLRTRFYLAETYEKMGKKEDAKREYRYCANLPDNAIPELTPETRLYKRLAKERLKKMK